MKSGFSVVTMFHKKALGLIIAVVFAGATVNAQIDPTIDFDNFRLTAGSIMSGVSNNPGGPALGFSTEYTVDKYLFGTSGEFNFNTAKFTALTFDLGGGIPQGINEDMDFFIGISTLSVNLNAYGAGPFNCSFLFKLRYQKFVFESKTNFWDWQKGKDPILKENGYYGLSYRIVKNMAAGIQYKLIAENASYLNVHFGFIW